MQPASVLPWLLCRRGSAGTLVLAARMVEVGCPVFEAVEDELQGYLQAHSSGASVEVARRKGTVRPFVVFALGRRRASLLR